MGAMAVKGMVVIVNVTAIGLGKPRVFAEGGSMRMVMLVCLVFDRIATFFYTNEVTTGHFNPYPNSCGKSVPMRAEDLPLCPFS